MIIRSKTAHNYITNGNAKIDGKTKRDENGLQFYILTNFLHQRVDHVDADDFDAYEREWCGMTPA